MREIKVMRKVKSLLSDAKDALITALLVSLLIAPVLMGVYSHFGNSVFYFLGLVVLGYTLPSVVEADAVPFTSMFILYWFVIGVAGMDVSWGYFFIVTLIILAISKIIFTIYLLLRLGNKKITKKEFLSWFKLQYAGVRREKLSWKKKTNK